MKSWLTGKDSDAGKDWRQEEKRMTEDKMVGWPTQRTWVSVSSRSRWCHPTISSSVIPFSSCLQSFPASESFQMNQFFSSGGPSIGVSALASVLPTIIQDWFPLQLTGLITLLSKGLSRIFSSITIWKHQFFDAYPSLWSNSYICTWLLEKQNKTKHHFDHIDHCWQSNFSVFQYTV